MNRKKWMMGAGIGLAVLVGAALGMGPVIDSRRKAAAENESSTGRVVKLYRVGGAPRDSSIVYPGRVQPVHWADLFFRVSGPVIEQNLKFGQTVEAGDVLMRIDPRDYEREVERLKHELELQKVQLSLADTEFQRQKKLFDSNAASRAVYDTAQTKKEAAEAQVKILETSLKVACDCLHDTTLVAPFHGTVSEIRIEQYEIANANVTVVVLQDLRDLEIKVNIPAGNLPDVSIYDGTSKYRNMRFKVTFPGRGDRVFEASIREFKPMAAAESETYELVLEMKQPEDFVILPGMTAEVHGLPYLTKYGSDELRLPFAAVFRRGEASCVWVYHPDTGKLELRKITMMRPTDSDGITVTSGVRPGELVVAAGGDWLTENTPVRVLNPEVVHENH